MRILAVALLLSGFSLGAFADGEEGIADRIRKVGNVCIKNIECVQSAAEEEPVSEGIVDQSATAMEPVEEGIGDQSAAEEPVAENINDQSAAAGEPVTEGNIDQSAATGEPVSEGIVDQSVTAGESVTESITDLSAPTGETVAENINDQSAAVEPVAEGMDLVKENYAKTCGICHDAGVANAPKFGDAEQWASRISKGKDRLYMSSIIGMPPAMPVRGMCFSCSDDDLKALVDYMVEAATVTP